MRVLFMGTSAFAVPALLKLIDSEHEIVGVVTQPDSIQGRKRQVVLSAIKEVSLIHELEIMQFQSIRSELAINSIKKINPDIIIVVSYGQIIPVEILTLPLWGCINIHASLLPKYRGAAPIHRALMDGETITGITTMLMDEGLDTGDILLQDTLAIPDDIDRGQLEEFLAKMGAELLLATIAQKDRFQQIRKAQDSALATYAAMIKRQDEIIDWKAPAQAIHNQIRALSPHPGAYTILEDMELKIFKSRVVPNGSGLIPGQVLSLTREGLIIQTGDGCLEIIEVQRQGKTRMNALGFWRGLRLNTGLVFKGRGE